MRKMMSNYQFQHPRVSSGKNNTKYSKFYKNDDLSDSTFICIEMLFITIGLAVVVGLFSIQIYDAMAPTSDIIKEMIRNRRDEDKKLVKIFPKSVITSALAEAFHRSDVMRKSKKSPYTGPPLAVWWTEEGLGGPDNVICGNQKCNIISRESLENIDESMVSVYLFYASVMKPMDLPLNRKPSDIWILLHEESPKNMIYLFYKKFLQLFNYSATFSRHSDVPYPLHHMGTIKANLTSRRYFVKTADKNKLLDKIAPVLYIQSSISTHTQRDVYVKELMKHIKVDSFGKCTNNKKQPDELKENYLNKLNNPDFLKFTAKYKFTIAIENGVCNDYVTEKLWRPIHVGSVPIYFGSPQVRDWLPNNKSAILLTDYPTPLLMANYIKSLLANDTLYEEHLEHKTKRLISNQKIFEELKERPYQLNEEDLMSEFKRFACKLANEAANKTMASRTIDRSHYDCPVPITALTLKRDPLDCRVNMIAEAILEEFKNVFGV